jgi:CelD/BcsL family acetyltransferase involved in cellulose biosynthesis
MALEVLHEPAALEREWNELAERTSAVPWVRPGWVRAWANAFAPGALNVCAWRREGRLAALLPLVDARGGKRSPTNWHTPAFGFVAEDELAARELLGAVLAMRPRSLSLGFLGRGDAELVNAVASAGRYRTLSRTMQRSPYVPVDGDWETYVAGRDRKLMQDLGRRLRRLESTGEVSFTVETGQERLDELLEEGFAVEASGWKGVRGTAILAHPETRAFYTEVSRWAAERGLLRLRFLRLEGRAIAFKLMLEDERSTYDVKNGFLEGERKFAPGKLLTMHVLQEAFETGLESYEFLGGPDPFKLEWSDAARDRLLVEAFAPTPAGVVERTAYAYGRPLAKRVLAAVRRRR